MVVFFHANLLSLRGTDVALYDYACHNEDLLHNKSIIIVPKRDDHEKSVVARFSKRFPLYFYSTDEERHDIVKQLHGDVFYAIKAGYNDNVLVKGVRNCIHAVFKYHEPHGDVYAYVSEWLAFDQSAGKLPWVPHMVSLPATSDDLRNSLSIPHDAIVFGRYGGPDTFDIPFAQKAVVDLIRKREDVFFLFMNTNPFYPDIETKSFLDKAMNSLSLRKKINEKQLIHLKGNDSLLYKAMFINSCDAMLHARLRGETFGLAVAEFSSLNKPVFTYSLSDEKAHLQALGDKAMLYSSKKELVSKMNEFKRNKGGNYDAYSALYNPQSVMEKFNSVFLS